MMDQERAIFKAQIQLEQMVECIHKAAAAGKPIDQVERDLWKLALGLGKLLLQGYVELQGTGDLGETLEHEGRTLKRLEPCHKRRYVSVFGEFEIVRTVYGTREKQKHEVVPLDARLNLPVSDFSYVLQEWDQAFCVQGSYKKSGETVQRILGIDQSVRSLEDMTRSMAQEVEGFRESKGGPRPEEEGEIVVITADGKGVPMRRKAEEGERENQVRRTKGEKANQKRQACVGSVYTIDPFPRTAEDVVNELRRQEQQAKRPQPCQKEMRAELSREVEGNEVNGKDAIFEWFVKENETRNADGNKPVVCVMDGERCLWNKLKAYLPFVIGILDIFHVLERLWDAAYCFYREGSEEAQTFVTERLERILSGEVGRVIGGLKQMQTKQQLTGAKKKQLNTVITYLENHREFMAYKDYLEWGCPIGSGVAEGACRHLVKDRMELTGMRWTTKGAQAMLDLRAIYLNEDWDAFQLYRIEHQQEQLYPYRDQIQEQWPLAA